VGVVDRLALLILRRILFPFSAGRAGLTRIRGAGWRISGIWIARAGVRSFFRLRRRLPQKRPAWLISGALSAALDTFASPAASVVVTGWPSPLSDLLGLVGILFGH
jgi:hypothetical protein